MTICYIGTNEDFDYRLAQVSTSGKQSINKERDSRILNKTIEILEDMGWKNWDWFGDGDDGEFAQIEVTDKDEYKELVADYKEAKQKASKIA